MKSKKTKLTSLVLAGTILTSGLGLFTSGEAHAADYSADKGKAVVQWKDPNTGKMYKEYGAKTKPVAKSKVSNKAKKIVPKTTYVDKYAGFATMTYKKNGKFVTEVADSQKAKWEHQQKYGKKVTKKIYYWYKGKRYSYTITFYAK